jgi:DtxR family transcriptional regulator, Mn-dependent transcriptional regulator
MNFSHDKTTQEYIEVIQELEKENKVARVKDIAERRGVCRSSVSLVLNQLRKKKLIFHEHYSHVTLTQKGRTMAEILYHRHQLIKQFLVLVLGLPEEIAETDACKFEHIVSNETINAIDHFLMTYENCPLDVPAFSEWVHKCRQTLHTEQKCDECPIINNISESES